MSDLIIAIVIVVFIVMFFYQKKSFKKADHIVLFYRDGCPFCDAFQSEWSKIEQVLKDRAKKYNTADPTIAQLITQFKISGVPTIILLQNNGAYETYLGSRNADEILKYFA